MEACFLLIDISWIMRVLSTTMACVNVQLSLLAGKVLCDQDVISSP